MEIKCGPHGATTVSIESIHKTLRFANLQHFLIKYSPLEKSSLMTIAIFLALHQSMYLKLFKTYIEIERTEKEILKVFIMLRWLASDCCSRMVVAVIAHC